MLTIPGDETVLLAPQGLRTVDELITALQAGRSLDPEQATAALNELRTSAHEPMV